MSVRNVHARHQSRDTSFKTDFGDVTLHADVFVDKSKLYAMKRRIIAGKVELDLSKYRHFRLKESGEIYPITEAWALRIFSFAKR